jgi:hypothetical protein
MCCPTKIWIKQIRTVLYCMLKIKYHSHWCILARNWLVEDCENKKLQQSDLKVSISLDVVVVAFMNTEGPLVPFPMSYYAC